MHVISISHKLSWTHCFWWMWFAHILVCSEPCGLTLVDYLFCSNRCCHYSSFWRLNLSVIYHMVCLSKETCFFLLLHRVSSGRILLYGSSLLTILAHPILNIFLYYCLAEQVFFLVFCNGSCITFLDEPVKYLLFIYKLIAGLIYCRLLIPSHSYLGFHIFHAV